jgi:Spy/CpxP family protein refolding chaperone
MGGQGQRRGMPSVDQRVQRLTKILNLNDDQQAKVKSILEDQQSQMSTLRQDTSMSQQDRRAKFMQIHQDAQQKVRAVLNDDQKAKFDQMQARRKERWQKQRGQGDTPAPDKQQ